MKKEALTILLIISMISCSPLAGVDQPVDSRTGKLHITKLDNGLTVSIKEAHALPLVTIQFWTHVGAKNEPEKYRGIAHIFEHIWFKGTETQPVGSFHKKVESLGGELNAMTSYDWTMYYVTVPANKFDEIFPYMADLLKNPAFDANEIKKEKEVILEEQRFSSNEPERYLDDQFAKLLLPKHPYGDPIIGYKNTIVAPNRDEIAEFYRTWYVPDNMNIVIAGDVQPELILEKIKKEFGELERQELPSLKLPDEPLADSPRYGSELRDVGYSYAAIGYQAPAADDHERYAFEVMNAIFNKGESSRLKKLEQDNTIVRGLSAYVPLNDLGVFEAMAVIEPEKKAQAVARIILELNKFKTQKVSEEELERAKQLLRAEKVKSKEEIFQVGFDIGQAWIDGDINKVDTYLANINAVTAEDIQRTANKYFTAYTLYEVKPKV